MGLSPGGGRVVVIRRSEPWPVLASRGAGLLKSAAVPLKAGTGLWKDEFLSSFWYCDCVLQILVSLTEVIHSIFAILFIHYTHSYQSL